MMKKFVVKDGVIVNIIEADNSFTMKDHEIFDAEGVEGEIGFTWANGAPVIPAKPPKEITKHHVNKEREKRIESGLAFNGNTYDSDEWSQINIGFMAVAAKLAIVKGILKGNYRWADPNSDFQWITKDNKRVKMDAHDMSAMGDAMAAYKTRLVFKSRDLKDMAKIPADYNDDKHW